MLVAVGLLAAACDRGARPPAPAAPGAVDAGDDTVGFAVGRAEGEWREFTPPGEGITVRLPGVPKENRWTPKVEGFEIPEITWALEREDRSVAFTLTAIHFPPGFLPPVTEVPLDRQLEKESLHCFAFDRTELASLEQHVMDVDGTPGLDAIAVHPRGLVMLQKVLKRGEVTYCLAASLRPDAPDSARADAERYLSSFKLR
jgi:hypothetical protein